MKIRRPLVWLACLQLCLIWIAKHHTSFFERPLPKNSIASLVATERKQLVCDGSLTLPPDVGPSESHLIIDLHQCRGARESLFAPVSGRVRVSMAARTDFLKKGDLLRFQSSLRQVTEFKNPGSFRAKLHYETKGIQAMGYGDPEMLMVLQPAPLSGFGGGLEKIRNRLKTAIVNVTSSAQSAVLLTLLIDDRSYLSSSLMKNFQKSGVAHILSISGLHVAMVAGLILIFFRLFAAVPLFSRSIFWVRFSPLLCLAPIWLYIAVAQFPLPAVRSGIMASCLLLAWSAWRRLDLLSALSLASFVLLALSPLSLFGASYQLSFTAVLSLILFFPRWQKFLLKFSLAKPVHWILEAFGVSFITLAGLGPLLFLHFHELSFVGIVANVVIVPFANIFLMPLAMVGWLFSGWFGWEWPLLWKLTGFLTGLFLKMVKGFASWEWGIGYGAFAPWQIFIYYGALSLLLLQQTRLHLRLRLALASLLVSLIGLGGIMPSDGKLRITFLDVGQGDCAVITLPNEKVWVVDGGGIRYSDFDIGRFVVAPALWEMGIREIDAIFLSHPHHDHFKGLQFLVEKFSPSILYTNGDLAPDSETSEWEKFWEVIEAKKLKVKTFARGEAPLQEGEVALVPLMPSQEGPRKDWDTNDNSAVFQLRYKEKSFLFAGDLMREGEVSLLAIHPELKSTVLKTGHHGSETSTTPRFLNAVSPQYAVISVGEYNPYGMPGKSVISGLNHNGISVYRTDRHGAITFETDGHALAVKTFVP